MRKNLKRIGVAILTIAATANAQHGSCDGPKPEPREECVIREIELVEDEWNLINEVSDPIGKEKLLAEDSYHVGPSGRVYTKAQDIMAALSSRAEREASGRVLRFHNLERRIRLYRDVAVVTVTAYSTSTVKGETRKGNPFRAVHVWEKRGGSWLLVVDQVTGMAQ